MNLLQLLSVSIYIAGLAVIKCTASENQTKKEVQRKKMSEAGGSIPGVLEAKFGVGKISGIGNSPEGGIGIIRGPFKVGENEVNVRDRAPSGVGNNAVIRGATITKLIIITPIQRDITFSTAGGSSTGGSIMSSVGDAKYNGKASGSGDWAPIKERFAIGGRDPIERENKTDVKSGAPIGNAISFYHGFGESTGWGAGASLQDRTSIRKDNGFNVEFGPFATGETSIGNLSFIKGGNKANATVPTEAENKSNFRQDTNLSNAGENFIRGKIQDSITARTPIEKTRYSGDPNGASIKGIIGNGRGAPNGREINFENASGNSIIGRLKDSVTGGTPLEKSITSGDVAGASIEGVIGNGGDASIRSNIGFLNEGRYSIRGGINNAATGGTPIQKRRGSGDQDRVSIKGIIVNGLGSPTGGGIDLGKAGGHSIIKTIKDNVTSGNPIEKRGGSGDGDKSSTDRVIGNGSIVSIGSDVDFGNTGGNYIRGIIKDTATDGTAIEKTRGSGDQDRVSIKGIIGYGLGSPTGGYIKLGKERGYSIIRAIKDGVTGGNPIKKRGGSGDGDRAFTERVIGNGGGVSIRRDIDFGNTGRNSIRRIIEDDVTGGTPIEKRRGSGDQVRVSIKGIIGSGLGSPTSGDIDLGKARGHSIIRTLKDDVKGGNPFEKTGVSGDGDGASTERVIGNGGGVSIGKRIYLGNAEGNSMKWRIKDSVTGGTPSEKNKGSGDLVRASFEGVIGNGGGASIRRDFYSVNAGENSTRGGIKEGVRGGTPNEKGRDSGYQDGASIKGLIGNGPGAPIEKEIHSGNARGYSMIWKIKDAATGGTPIEKRKDSGDQDRFSIKGIIGSDLGSPYSGDIDLGKTRGHSIIRTIKFGVTGENPIENRGASTYGNGASVEGGIGNVSGAPVGIDIYSANAWENSKIRSIKDDVTGGTSLEKIRGSGVGDGATLKEPISNGGGVSIGSHIVFGNASGNSITGGIKDGFRERTIEKTRDSGDQDGDSIKQLIRSNSGGDQTRIRNNANIIGRITVATRVEGQAPNSRGFSIGNAGGIGNNFKGGTFIEKIGFSGKDNGTSIGGGISNKVGASTGIKNNVNLRNGLLIGKGINFDRGGGESRGGGVGDFNLGRISARKGSAKQLGSSILSGSTFGGKDEKSESNNIRGGALTRIRNNANIAGRAFPRVIVVTKVGGGDPIGVRNNDYTGGRAISRLLVVTKVVGRAAPSTRGISIGNVGVNSIGSDSKDKIRVGTSIEKVGFSGEKNVNPLKGGIGFGG